MNSSRGSGGFGPSPAGLSNFRCLFLRHCGRRSAGGAATGSEFGLAFRDIDFPRVRLRKVNIHAEEKRRPVAIGFVGSRRLRRSRRSNRERLQSNGTALDRDGSGNGANSREVDFSVREAEC
jgi:hypothetical protein